MSKPVWEWNESDLRRLIGEPESMRLEFKSARLLMDPKQKDKVTDDISKAVSAFANCEGGILIIGLEESKSGAGPRRATEIVGTTEEHWDKDRLQRVIEGNLSPPLPGIRLQRIPLGEPQVGKVAFAIGVPSGITAYQASDRKYYGRSEFESKPLPDLEIRLRMMRLKVAQAQISANVPQLIRSADEVVQRRLKHTMDRRREIREMTAVSGIDITQVPADDDEPQVRVLRQLSKPVVDVDYLSDKAFFSEYIIEFEFENMSDISILDFEFEAVLRCDPGFIVTSNAKLQPPEGFDSVYKPEQYLEANLSGALPSFVKTRNRPAKVWPRAKIAVGSLYLLAPAGRKIAESRLRLDWRISLDDAPPNEGSIDFASAFAQLSEGA